MNGTPFRLHIHFGMKEMIKYSNDFIFLATPEPKKKNVKVGKDLRNQTVRNEPKSSKGQSSGDKPAELETAGKCTEFRCVCLFGSNKMMEHSIDFILSATPKPKKKGVNVGKDSKNQTVRNEPRSSEALSSGDNSSGLKTSGM